MGDRKKPGRPSGSKNKRPKRAKSGRRPGMVTGDMLRNVCDKQRNFIEALEVSKGIIVNACRSIGITRTCYDKWLAQYPDFRMACEIIKEEQIDFVESKLLQNIDDLREASINFYLGTKGKDRGYVSRTEKVVKEVTDFEDKDKEIMDAVLDKLKGTDNEEDKE